MSFRFNTSKTESEDNYTDFLTIQRYMNIHGDNRVFPAGSFSPDSAASIEYKAAMGVLTLPDSGSANNRGSITFLKPESWTFGTVRAKVSYTSNVAGGLYYCQALWYTTSEGSVINTGSSSGYDAIPAISSNYELGIHTFSSTDTIDATTQQISFRLTRDGTDGSDTSSQDLYITSINFEYVPSRQSA